MVEWVQALDLFASESRSIASRVSTGIITLIRYMVSLMSLIRRSYYTPHGTHNTEARRGCATWTDGIQKRHDTHE